jgi:hypothetical protein
VKRIVLLDGPSVLSRDVLHEVAERYGLGLVRASLSWVAENERLAVGEPALLAPVFLAALHEAAMLVAADGEDLARATALVDQLVVRLTTPATGR